MGIGTLTVPSGTFHLSGNPIRVLVSGATAPAGCTDYKVLLKITSTDGLLEGGPFIDAIAPLSGAAEFDVSGLVDAPLDKTFEWSLSGGLNPYTNDTLDVTFTPGERYIDDEDELVENWGSASAAHYIVKGGVSFKQLGVYYDDSSSFYAEFVQGGKFLTRMPVSQVVHPYQPVKLWLLADASGSVTANIKGYYDDGTTYTKSYTYTLYVNILHEMNVLPYHWDATNLAPVKGTAKMTKYEVWITSLSETRTFVVDHNYYENCYFLFVANSLGGIDVIWLNGSVQKGFDSEMVTAIKPWTSTNTRKDRTKIISSRAGRRTWKVNTGYKSSDEMHAMTDILLSRQVWILENASTYNGGVLYPVVVKNSSSLLTNTMEDLHSLDLDLEEAHDNQYL